MDTDRLSDQELSHRFLERLTTIETQLRDAEQSHVRTIATTESELIAAKLQLDHARERVRAYKEVVGLPSYGRRAPSLVAYMRLTEELLEHALAFERESAEKYEIKAKQAEIAHSVHDASLKLLRLARQRILREERNRLPRGADLVAIDDLIDALPPLQPSATAGRECQRCAEPVPRGRKRFCSTECRLLYLEENGHPEHGKRSRYYDYGTDDPEDERW
ncbi:MAG: hypothetical protein K2R93_02925 [Gemmatimonadaceae bacterium]|nr:hypothetical protein [Gemmatimonadaceae bacterium]